MKVFFGILSSMLIAASVNAQTTPAQATAIVQQLFASTTVSSAAIYCGFQPDWQCRTINYLVDKTTQQPVNAFWTTFSAPGRRAGGVHYFVAVNPNQSGLAGQYQVFSYPYLDTSVQVTEVYSNTQVNGTYGNISEITNDTLSVLGTPSYVRNVDIVVTNNTMTLNGTIYSTLTSQSVIGSYQKSLTVQQQPAAKK